VLLVSQQLRRIGRPVIYRYLLYFAAWAAGGMAVAGLFLVLAKCVRPDLMPFGWIVVGAMAGAWFFTAARRREVSFEGVQDFLDVRYEPFIRLVFVGLLAVLAALLLKLDVLSLTIGSANLSKFATDPTLAFVLGLIAGIGERTLSVQVVERVRKVLAPGEAQPDR